MRILMLNNEFPPLGGGTGTVTLAMLEQFERIPVLEIDLITSALKSRTEEKMFASTIKIYKVPVRNKNIHHASNRELSEYFIRGLWLALNLQRQRSFNICFAWSAVPAGAIALVLRRIAGLRYIVRVCGPDIPGFERRYQTIHRFLSPLIRRIWRGAERVVAKSEHEIEMIHAVDPTVDCLLIPNGVDGNRFKPISDAPDGGPLRLLCVGRLIERKGQHHLIEAVKRLTDEKIDVRLDLVGTGDARFDNEAQVDQLGLADRIRFLGYVPREVIAEHYATAHVFVLPSYNEGMSVALLEAMASGLAVVATRTAGTWELVEPEVNGLVFDWGDVDSLTAHLRRLAQDRSSVRRMGTAARQRTTEYSWDRAALRYFDLLKQLTDVVPVASANLNVEAKRKA
jgi:glycosyltransferase involved in cell wall biosynthesis